MNTKLSDTSVSSYVGELRAVFADTERPIEWLLIAHDDDQMLNALLSALSGQSAAVLVVSQDKWTTDWEQLSETIEWALQQSEIKNVVLVGQLEAVESLPESPTPKSQSGYDRLRLGAQQTNTRTRNAQKEFAAHVDQVAQIPVAHARWSDDALAVYGLFYRCLDGIFLICEPDSDTIRPIVNA